MYKNSDSNDIINKLIDNKENIIINDLNSWKIIELNINKDIITFKGWKYNHTETIDDVVKNKKPFRNVDYNLNNEKDLKSLSQDIEFYR